MVSLIVSPTGSGCKDRSDSDNSADQAQANAPVEIELSPPLPCWHQSWNCGTWRPLATCRGQRVAGVGSQVDFWILMRFILLGSARVMVNFMSSCSKVSPVFGM